MKRTILPGYLPGENGQQIKTLLSAVDKNVFSHPNKVLSCHLEGVWYNCASLINEFGLPIDGQKMFIAALTHDVGKADQRFQNYVFRRGKGVVHAHPSAWFALLFARESGLSFRNAIWIAETIRRHHTGLVNFSNLEAAWLPDHLDWQKVCDDTKSLLPEYTAELKADDLEALKDAFFDIEDDLNESLWLEVRLMYSLLIASDRMDAIGINDVSLSPFPVFVKPVFEEPHDEISLWRDKVQQNCLKSALEKIKGPGAYSLTLPTGAGKTLTGIRIADAVIRKFNYKSLIYALPFISIVEQTTALAQKIYDPAQVQEDHSLRTSDSSAEESELWQRMTDLFRYWHTPIILTTMVQFWDAIFAPQANRTMNLHRLGKAVVILDEPQTIAPNYWKSFGNILQFLAQKLGIVFILMTATQPHILGEEEKRSELSPEKYRFPAVRHHYSAIEIEHKFGVDKVLKIIGENCLFEKMSGLAVFNTRRSALLGYDQIYDNLPSPEIDLKFMSTWLTPWRRKKVLEEVKNSKQPHILISTQVVEAGVDLDFEWVFRDFGPLDSIIQVAGRCNRHYKRKEPGQIFIARLCQETNGRKNTFASMVYNPILLEATYEVLQRVPNFSENEVPELVERYYQSILSRVTPVDLFQELKKGNWGEMQELYSDRGENNILLVVEENENVEPLIRRIENGTWSLENHDEKKRLMQELQQYIIAIPQKHLGNIQMKCSQFPSEQEVISAVMGNSMYYLRNAGIGEKNQHIYHPVKGYVPPDEQADVFMY